MSQSQDNSAKPGAPQGANAPADGERQQSNVAPLAAAKPQAPNAQAGKGGVHPKVPAPQPKAPSPNTPPVGPAVDMSAFQPVSASRLKRRHRAVLASFILAVILPVALVGWYLWQIADDQYASTVGFSVRTEEVGSAVELLGGITELSGSSSSDTDILYEFIQSQKLVRDIDEQLDLRAIWSEVEYDPVFAYERPGTIEDLLSHWQRKVKVYYDSGTGLIEVRVLAFAAEDSHAIATAIYDESSAMINELNAIAREDSIRYARDELEVAVERLREARQVLTEFRNRNQIVDPSVDLQSQAGLLGNLEGQLAEAIIELDLLEQTSKSTDPRVLQYQRRVQVIEERIAAERQKLGIGSGAGQGDVLATLVGEYERLVVDREFAEQAYTSALAAYDGALAEARRQSRYLAAHVLPTLAEKAEYPQRWLLTGLIGLFLLVSWAISVMIYYALRDRR